MDFYTTGKDATGAIRWKDWCKKCELETQKIKRYTNPVYKAYHDRMSIRWHNNNREQQLLRFARWRVDNPDYEPVVNDKRQEVIDLLMRDIALREKRHEQLRQAR